MRGLSPARVHDISQLTVTYSTTESAKPPKAPKYAKTTTTLSTLSCLNHTTRYYFNTKGDFSLPLKPTNLDNFEAAGLLLRPLTLNARLLINALTESYSAPKLPLTALSSPATKSKQLFKISLTLIREDSRPGCVRWQIWLINCWVRVVGS